MADEAAPTPGPVLDVRDLRVTFRGRSADVHAVNGVSFSLRPGECLGVVGESGSGKSVTVMSLLGLLPSPPAEVTGGPVTFEGRDLLRLDPRAMRAVRGGEVGFVFQDPMTSLNPVLSVGFQIAEPLRKHLGLSKRAARARAAELLALVGIPRAGDRLDDYPHQFSGGMRQRVMIAIALACDPKVLIADEPTTALDVTIQAQILELLRELVRDTGAALVMITHDLGVVAGLCETVNVLYGGRIVERAQRHRLFATPRHPYTNGLLGSIPRLDAPAGEELNAIPGSVADNLPWTSACAFAPRCPRALEVCTTVTPEAETSGGRLLRCHNPVPASAE
jgi:peptide/nickel transport system ATP-binding protein